MNVENIEMKTLNAADNAECNLDSQGKARRQGKQAGFTLIEVMIAIIILLIILVAIMSRGDSTFSSSDASTELGHVSSLITGTKQLKTSSGYGTSGTDLTTLLDTQGGVPADMTYSASKLYNQWNGQVNIVSTGLGFTLKFQGVPQPACITLATKLAAYAYSTTINANAAIVGEVTAAVAGAQCNNALTNTLTWTVNG